MLLVTILFGEFVIIVEDIEVTNQSSCMPPFKAAITHVHVHYPVSVIIA